MRLLFICQECGTHYLPPESMRYEVSGDAASPLWCSDCQTLMRERGISESPVAAAVALVAAQAALRAYVPLGAEARPDVRPSRPARTSRGRGRPSSARSKLN
jgi:hypothetical protein